MELQGLLICWELILPIQLPRRIHEIQPLEICVDFGHLCRGALPIQETRARVPRVTKLASTDLRIDRRGDRFRAGMTLTD